MAECHPVGFQWVMEAKARGATVIHADPRFTRTSALADIHVPLRAGSDIAFLGGLINHVLTHDKWFHEYVVAYTNAPMILREDFEDTEDLDGLFSGFDEESRHYDPSTWQYEGADVAAAAGQRDQWKLWQRDEQARSRSEQGRSTKDRTSAGQEPACAKACPTDSIQYGPLDELRDRAAHRVDALDEAGVEQAQLYGHDPADGVGGDGALFLLLDRPEVYGLPPDPVVTTRDLPTMWKQAALAAAGAVAAVAAAFVGARR